MSVLALATGSVGVIAVATAAAPTRITGAATAARPAVRIRASGPQVGGC
ncbi:MAG: hypothetical protein JWM34_4327, partial [Ilumatobacteraceae bacterium]|nr:hypothetical protein [Ilumatobacteraceae bacterium]